MTPDTYRHRSIEYGTERPCEVARIAQDDGKVTLAYRYLDDGSEWFPTWTGTVGNAVKVPRGWLFNEEWLALIEAAPVVEHLEGGNE